MERNERKVLFTTLLGTRLVPPNKPPLYRDFSSQVFHTWGSDKLALFSSTTLPCFGMADTLTGPPSLTGAGRACVSELQRVSATSKSDELELHVFKLCLMKVVGLQLIFSNSSLKGFGNSLEAHISANLARDFCALEDPVINPQKKLTLYPLQFNRMKPHGIQHRRKSMCACRVRIKRLCTSFR